MSIPPFVSAEASDLIQKVGDLDAFRMGEIASIRQAARC